VGHDEKLVPLSGIAHEEGLPNSDASSAVPSR
jgi:hypothetical protein